MAFRETPGGWVLDSAEALPANGVRLAAAPADEVLRSAGHGKVYGQAADHVFFGANHGLVRYADDSWRAFPLETADAFVIRDCGSVFVARVHRVRPEAVPPMPLVVVGL